MVSVSGGIVGREACSSGQGVARRGATGAQSCSNISVFKSILLCCTVHLSSDSDS
jgi:hypothetical protein